MYTNILLNKNIIKIKGVIKMKRLQGKRNNVKNSVRTKSNIRKANFIKKANESNETLLYDAAENIDMAINRLAEIDWSDEDISDSKSEIQQYIKTLTNISNKLDEYCSIPSF